MRESNAAQRRRADEELERLRAIRDELVAALHSIALCTDDPAIRLTAREAIAKAKEQP